MCFYKNIMLTVNLYIDDILVGFMCFLVLKI